MSGEALLRNFEGMRDFLADVRLNLDARRALLIEELERTRTALAAR